MPSASVFLFLLMVVVGECLSILGLALLSIGFLQRLLTPSITTLNHFVNIGVLLLSAGGVFMVIILVTLFFGLSNLLAEVNYTSISTQTTTLKRDGSPSHGPVALEYKPTTGGMVVLEQESSPFVTLQPRLNTLLNTQQSKSKRNCLICGKIKDFVGGG